MNREMLKELGLEKAAIDKIMAEYGKAVKDLQKEADKVEGLNNQVEDQKTQLKERNEQLDDLNKLEPEKLKEELEKYKATNEQQATEFEVKLQSQAKDNALNLKLISEGAKDNDLVKSKMDLEAITLKDGELIGYDDVVKGVKENFTFLFGEEDKGGLKGKNPNEHKEKSNVVKNPFNDDTFNLTEQGRLLRDEPERYAELKAQAGK